MGLFIPMPTTQNFDGSRPTTLTKPYRTPCYTRSTGIHLVGSRSQIPEIRITRMEGLCQVPCANWYCDYSNWAELVETRRLVSQTGRHHSHIRCSARLANPILDLKFQLCINQTRALK